MQVRLLHKVVVKKKKQQTEQNNIPLNNESMPERHTHRRDDNLTYYIKVSKNITKIIPDMKKNPTKQNKSLK